MHAAPTPIAAHLAATQDIDPQALAGLIRPLTDTEVAEVDAFLAELQPLSADQVAARLHIPVDLVAEFRRLMNLADAR